MLVLWVEVYLARLVPGCSNDELHPYEECKNVLDGYRNERVAGLPIFQTFLGVLDSYF